MKLIKKLSLLLCLCFTFSSVATSCSFLDSLNNSSSESQSSSEKKPGNSSSSDEEEEDSEDDKESTSNIDIFLGLLVGRLEEAENAKIEFSVTNNGLLQTGVFESNTVWTMLSGDAFVTKTEEGFDAQISLKVASLDNPTQTEDKAYYFIDGYVYEYFAATNTYNKFSESLDDMLGNFVHAVTQGVYTPESMLDLILGADLMAGTMLTYDDIKEKLDGVAVLESGVEENNEGMWITVDATEKSNELFKFVGSLTKNTTYGEIADFLLKQISPKLSTAKILDELYPRGRDTLQDLVEEFDVKSKEETGKSLQENLNSILKNKVVKELVQSLLKEENANLATAILNFNIDEFMKQESTVTDDNGKALLYGELTLNRLSKVLVAKLVEALGSEGNEILGELGLLSDNVNLGLLLGAVEMILDWKAFENLEDDSKFFKLVEEAKTLNVTKTDGKLEVTLNDAGVEKIQIDAKLNGNRVNNGATVAAGGEMNLLISEFSETAITIMLPANATLNEEFYSQCAECKESKASVAYRQDKYKYLCDECNLLAPAPEETPEE